MYNAGELPAQKSSPPSTRLFFNAGISAKIIIGGKNMIANKDLLGIEFIYLTEEERKLLELIRGYH
jgi:hypothetical protein